MEQLDSSTNHVTQHNEAVVRRDWLNAFILMTLFSICSSIAVALFQKGGTKDILESQGVSHPQLIVLSGMLFIQIPWSWITYHCAYKKRGTRWLLFELIVVSLGLIFSISGSINTIFDSEAPYTWVIALAAWGINLFFLVCSYRLYKENRAQKMGFLSTPEYLECLSDLEKSGNLEELKAQFHLCITKWPQWEKHLSNAYKAKKASF